MIAYGMSDLKVEISHNGAAGRPSKRIPSRNALSREVNIGLSKSLTKEIN